MALLQLRQHHDLIAGIAWRFVTLGRRPAGQGMGSCLPSRRGYCRHEVAYLESHRGEISDESELVCQRSPNISSEFRILEAMYTVKSDYLL
jgi:hypothetical protein